jgi:translation initiation factor 1 (eIF-1/SUI1)
VVITDDLQMKSISDHYGLETILLRAIQAGADVLTFSNNVVDADPEIIARVVATVRQLVRQGVLAEDRIKASVDRIRDLKARAAELGKRRGTGATASASIPEAPPEASGHEELVRYREQLAMIQRRVEELLAPLDDRQLSWRPGPERWSVGECIEHLSIIGSLLAPKMEEAIQRGKKEGLYGRDPFTYSWPGRMFVESLQPSARVRIRTMRMYTPRRGVTKVQIVEKFQRTQKELLRLAGEAEGLDLARIKVASPANRLLRFSLGIWFAATVAHAQRHCEQAKRVLKEKEFPA